MFRNIKVVSGNRFTSRRIAAAPQEVDSKVAYSGVHRDGSIAKVTTAPSTPDPVELAPASPRCRQCGYPLLHLSTPKCPECGTAFDLGNPKSFVSGRMLSRWRTRIAVVAGCLAAYVAGVLAFSSDHVTANVALVWPVIGLISIAPIWCISIGVIATVVGSHAFYLLRPSRVSLGLMLLGYVLWYWWGQLVFEGIANC